MLTKRIIPCLDVTNGRVVKGTHFVHLKDAGDPIELAAHYNAEGADELVFLDITATSDHRDTMLHIIEKTAKQVHIPLTVGGGVRTVADIRQLLNAGVDKASINSAAVRNPKLIEEGSKQFGAQCIIVAIDAKKAIEKPSAKSSFIEHIENQGILEDIAMDTDSVWEVVINGGRVFTGIDAVKWANLMNQYGAGEILLTSMDKDGTKSGYDIHLTQAVSQHVQIPVIASGGAGTLDHISLALGCCEAALLASLLHYKELTIDQIKQFCMSQGHPIRHMRGGII
jgi:cyclase